MLLQIANGPTRFEHEVFDAGGRPYARLRLPNGAPVARNREDATWIPSGWQDRHATIETGDGAFRIDYDVVRSRRIRANDLRFVLNRVDDRGGCEVARLEVRPLRDVRRLSVPAGRFDLLRRHRWFRLCYTLRSAGGLDDVGSIEETTRFLAGRRTFDVELPDAIEPPAQIFAFFVALSANYR